MKPIGDLDELHDHLQVAIGLELTTIPAYLCALYSMDADTNGAAAEVIQSVVLEEMLHMALAANVLNAIGGTPSTGPIPRFGLSTPVPTYPSPIPLIPAVPIIHLQRFSPAALDLFLAIEHPSEPATDPNAPDDTYGSTGEFYAAISRGLVDHATPEAFAAAGRSRSNCQVTPQSYYGGAGKLIGVHDIDNALAAIDEIVREGEGIPARSLTETITDQRDANTADHVTPYRVDDLDRLGYGWKMYSHYARFKEVRTGRHFEPGQLVEQAPAGDFLLTDWSAVCPMAADPTADGVSDPGVRDRLAASNRAYTAVVDALYGAFNGATGALGGAVTHMYDLKYQALALMNTPNPADPATTLGPPFAYQPET